MSIINRGKHTYLVRVYVGRDPITKKRIEINETVRGSLSYARKVETKLKDQKYSGKLIKSPKMKVDELADLFFDSIRHSAAPATYDSYSSFYKAYSSPYIGHLPITQISHSDIQRFFNFLLDAKEPPLTIKGEKKISPGLGLAPSSVKVVRRALIGLFKLAVADGLIAANPVSSVRVKIKKKPSVASSLTIEEAKSFVSVKDQYWYGNAFVLQLHTGLRNQELMALIWDDVDFEKGTLRIERAVKWVKHVCVEVGPPKTEGSYRVIDLEQEQLDLLRLQLKRQEEVIERCKRLKTWYGEPRIDEWLGKERSQQSHLYRKTNVIFPKSDGRIPGSDSVRYHFKRMLRSAGIERNLRWYDLRHTHTSILADLGVADAKTAARTGHSIETLRRDYLHPVSDSPRRASRVFSDLIPTQIAPLVTSQNQDE